MEIGDAWFVATQRHLGLRAAPQTLLDVEPDCIVLVAEYRADEVEKCRLLVRGDRIVGALMEERMRRRVAELPSQPLVRITIDDRGLNDDLRSDLVAPVQAPLEMRTIRIEPSNWIGAEVLVDRD